MICYLFKFHYFQLEKEEELFFSIHNDSQIAKAMSALREISLNARVVNKGFLLEAKQEMDNQISQCRKDENTTSSIPIYPQDLNITTVRKFLFYLLTHI